MDWAVAIPVWGDEFFNKWTKWSLPAIKEALKQLPPEDNVRFIIHTDKPPEVFDSHLSPYPAQFHGVPGGENAHVKLGEINRHALQLVAVGEIGAFINSDMVPSVEVFSASRQRFVEGKKLIMVMGTRVLEDSGNCVPPIGAASRHMLNWAWEHRHGWTTQCIWKTGNTRSPTVLYFPLSDGVVLHAFHLHPFAVVKDDASLSFHGVTIDRDLQDQFTYDKIHVVTSADDMAFAELSPQSKDLGQGAQLTVQNVAGFAKNVATTAHRWVFGHRIEIIGPANDLGDISVVSQILHEIEIYIPNPQPGAPEVMGTMNFLSRERQEVLKKQAATAKAAARRFFICLPAWGERHVEIASKYVIPAVGAAWLRALDTTVRFMVYTDQPEVMKKALDIHNFQYDLRRANLEINPHEMMNIAHKQVITETPVGASIVLLDGDTVPSCELFSRTLDLFPAKRVIATSALRTLLTEQGPPIGVTGRELLGWAWRNRHPIAEACVWGPRSHTGFPNVVFFDDEKGNVVMHTFHVHPFVMLKDRNPHYKGTIDDDLLNNYEKHEIEYVTGAEMGFVEISPPDWGASYYSKDGFDPMTVENVAKFAKIMIPCHWRNFRQQIRVTGDDPMAFSNMVAEQIERTVRPSIHHPWPQEAQERMAR